MAKQTPDEVKKSVQQKVRKALKKPGTVAEAAARAGVSLGAARQVVLDLVSAGQLTQVSSASPNGRGGRRAAIYVIAGTAELIDESLVDTALVPRLIRCLERSGGRDSDIGMAAFTCADRAVVINTMASLARIGRVGVTQIGSLRIYQLVSG